MTSLAERVAHVLVPQPRARWTLSLVGVLARKNFQTRFKRSFFGILWVLVQPAIQAFVLFFLVVKVFKVTTIEDYPLFALSGAMPWAFTTQGVNAATASIVENAALVKKVRVPPIVFPMATVGGFLLGFLAPLGLLVVASAVTGEIRPSAVFLPLLIGFHASVILAAATLTTGFHVLYRDVKNLVEALMALLFYATPIMYEASLLPPWAQTIVRFNPMTGVLSVYRGMFTGRAIDWLAVGIAVVEVLVVLPIATVVFNRRAGEFADLV